MATKTTDQIQETVVDAIKNHKYAAIYGLVHTTANFETLRASSKNINDNIPNLGVKMCDEITEYLDLKGENK